MILQGTYYPIIIPICSFMVRVCHAIAVIKLFVTWRRASTTTTRCNNCGWLYYIIFIHKMFIWLSAAWSSEHRVKQLTTIGEHLKRELPVTYVSLLLWSVCSIHQNFMSDGYCFAFWRKIILYLQVLSMLTFLLKNGMETLARYGIT